MFILNATEITNIARFHRKALSAYMNEASVSLAVRNQEKLEFMDQKYAMV